MGDIIDNKENSEKLDHLYRKGVGMMIINGKKEIFVGKRIDNNSDAWQMPQGGIDEDEDEEVAMYRELKEETGIAANNVKILEVSKDYYFYNLPYKLQKKFWGGKYLGQRQRWYLLEFVGSDDAININTIEPEFSEWKWIARNEIISKIVSFKRPLYESVIKEFSKYL